MYFHIHSIHSAILNVKINTTDHFVILRVLKLVNLPIIVIAEIEVAVSERATGHAEKTRPPKA